MRILGRCSFEIAMIAGTVAFAYGVAWTVTQLFQPAIDTLHQLSGLYP